MRDSARSALEPPTTPEIVTDIIQIAFVSGLLSHDGERYFVSDRFLEQPEFLIARARPGMQRLRDALKRHVDLRLRDGGVIGYVAEFLRLVGYAPDSEPGAGDSADIAAFRAAVAAFVLPSPGMQSTFLVACLIGIQWFVAAVEIERIAERIAASSLSNAHTTAPDTSP